VDLDDALSAPGVEEPGPMRGRRCPSPIHRPGQVQATARRAGACGAESGGDLAEVRAERADNSS